MSRHKQPRKYDDALSRHRLSRYTLYRRATFLTVDLPPSRPLRVSRECARESRSRIFKRFFLQIARQREREEERKLYSRASSCNICYVVVEIKINGHDVATWIHVRPSTSFTLFPSVGLVSSDGSCRKESRVEKPCKNPYTNSIIRRVTAGLAVETTYIKKGKKERKTAG